MANHPTNSRYLKWFHAIEKTLWAFFALFDDLCARCAERTVREAAAGQRQRIQSWCCCMIDNQVHDNWESLDAVQSRFNRNWYSALGRSRTGRMPGNGPCPALGDRGCRIGSCRPITCTTQLCSQMLLILNRLGIMRRPADSALQIEDLIALPDILPALYGIGRPRKVLESDVNAYIKAVKELGSKLAAVPAALRRKTIEEVSQGL